MLKVRYDPTAGTAVPDARTSGWVDELIRNWVEAGKPDTEVSVGCAMIVDQLRVRVIRGDIDTAELMFLFEHHGIYVGKYGNCSDWPRGFCDYTENLLMELIDAE